MDVDPDLFGRLIGATLRYDPISCVRAWQDIACIDEGTMTVRFQAEGEGPLHGRRSVLTIRFTADEVQELVRESASGKLSAGSLVNFQFAVTEAIVGLMTGGHTAAVVGFADLS
jgi:hypothetical protein